METFRISFPLSISVLVTLLLLSTNSFTQEKEFIGRKLLFDGNQSSFQTITSKNIEAPSIESLSAFNTKTKQAEKYVFGGSVIWSAQDAAAIANTAELNDDGSLPFNAWGLNNMRLTLYNELNNTPVWEFPSPQSDPNVAVSDDGTVIAVTTGYNFYLLDRSNGGIKFQIQMPDSFYTFYTDVKRDGSQAIYLAQATGQGTTSSIISLDLSGSTPLVNWTYDIPASEIGNWAGVNFTAYTNRVVVNGRNHVYVFNSDDGTLIWDRFVDNTESPAVISGDGSIIATADNSGFIQTRMFNPSTNNYDLLWQYRVPAGIYTNWASSIGISANGNTIVAGSLIFYASDYDGTIMAFDTFGDGTPKWVHTGAGDLVDDIAISDDGRVAAAVTWGDLNHLKPDLLVFDVETGELTFDVVTPGSFFTVDISQDGSKVLAGGKAVHAREFGNGGRLYFAEIDLGGGSVSGNVDLAGTSDNSGVLIQVSGLTRTAFTDVNGNYLIKNVPAGSYSITAEKPGYSFGSVSNVNVVSGDTTENVNFALAEFSLLPPVLNASTNLSGYIMLGWSTMFKSYEKQLEIAKAIGDPFTEFEEFSTQSVNSRSSENNSHKNSFDKMDLLDSIAVYRALVSGGPYTKIGSVDASQNNFADSTVFPLKDYYYVINLFNETGQSIYSNEVLGKVSDSLLTFSFDAPQGTVPNIDGIISPGEWSDAFKVDISDVLGFSGGSPKPQGSVFMYVKFNDENNTLYIAGEDFLNTSLDDNEGFGLYFDDNGNNMFEPQDALPVFQEGNFWAYWHPSGADLRFRKIFKGGGVGDVITVTDAQLVFTDGAGYVQAEVAIPMGFMEGYELQVFGPDKTPTLGAFLIERIAGAAVFNGWWPQTMNSVFNPLYFGDVGIDVSLTAPPYAPDNISVDRQNNDLFITWSDPTLGLNNDPLSVAPVVRLYRNNELYTTLNAGVGSFLDEDVECELWYEYKMDAYIVIGDDTLYSPMSRSFGDFACIEPEMTVLKYDDDSWEAFYVVDFNYDNNKFAVRFTPTYYPARVLRIETLVNDNGPFEFTINKDEGGMPGEILAGPYRVTSGVAAAVRSVNQTLPGNDPPEFDAGDYWVLINYLPESPGNPGIGTDTNPPNSNRGMYYLTSSGWQNATFGNLMISSYIADIPISVEDETNSVPLVYELSQNYPNPFNPSTTIKYSIADQSVVKLTVFNSIGQEVARLVNEIQEPGSYSVTFDASALSSGVYFYKISAGNFVSTRKMLLIK